eukprot:s10_g24.t3
MMSSNMIVHGRRPHNATGIWAMHPSRRFGRLGRLYECWQMLRPPLIRDVGQMSSVASGKHEKTAGIYVEIGAFDGITFSNTLSLHSCLGWSGMLIEGSPRNFERLRRNLATTRPSNVVVHFGAVCAPPESNLTFLTGKQTGLAEHGAADGDAKHLKPTAQHMSQRQYGTTTVPCKPMSWYLESLGSSHVDFFSLDVEGAELEVLLTMNFKEVSVEVFMIELLERSESDQQRNWKVINLMANLGYCKCRRAKIRHSGLFVREQGPFSSKCLSILQEERCVYTRAPAPNSLSCHDGRIYEVDLCDKFKCTGSRLPCGARVKAEYPKGMAFRNASEVKSLAGIGRAFTRTCAPPKLVDTIPETVIEGSQVQIKWSQPVRFSSEGRKGKRRFSLCHAATQELACPIVDEAFDESKVFPCTGPGGDCALWSIKVNTGQLPTCGGFIVTIEAGAVESEEGTGANELTRSWIQSEHHCPRWAEGSSCSLVDSDGLRSMYNRSHVSPTQLQLQVDLDHMQLRYNVLPPDFNFTVRRLASKSYLPRCLIVSPLPDFAQKLKQNFSQSLFEYVRLGGQLYVLGSSTNVEIMSQAFNLSLEAAETGNEQVRTMPAPNEALGFDSGLPTTLPVINQVLSLQMPSTTSIRFCKLRGASMNQQLWSFGLRLDCLPLREAMESTLSAAFLAAVALLYLSTVTKLKCRPTSHTLKAISHTIQLDIEERRGPDWHRPQGG